MCASVQISMPLFAFQEEAEGSQQVVAEGEAGGQGEGGEVAVGRGKNEAEIAEPAGQTAARPEVETDLFEEAGGPVHRAVEEARDDLPRGARDGRLGFDAGGDLRWQWCVEEVAGEREAEQQHPLGLRLAGLPQHVGPFEPGVCAEDLGHVADPREALPEVFRAVDTERQQEVIGRKALDRAGAEPNIHEPRPDGLLVGGLGVAPLRELPVQLDEEEAVLAREREVVLRAEEHALL